MAPKRKAAAGKGAGKASKQAAKAEVVEEVKEVVVEEEAPAPPAEATEAEKVEEEDDEKPSPKQAKTEEKRGRKGRAASKPAAGKKGAKAAVVESEEDPKKGPVPASKSSTVIVIEASKECNSIKTRAVKVQEGLKKALPELEVLVNPDKPRKGCFEIRDQEGTVYLSLLAMPRPYTKLKSLDLDKTVEEIVAKIK